MLQQYPSDNLIEMLNEPNPFVRHGIEILLEAKGLRELSDQKHLVVTQGFAAAFEFVRLITDEPLARMYTVISNYHSLGILLKEKMLETPDETLTEEVVNEIALFCIEQTMFSLSLYGVHAKKFDKFLPVFCDINMDLFQPEAPVRGLEDVIRILFDKLNVENIAFRYHPQLRHYTARLTSDHLKNYWNLAVGIEGLLRAKKMAYSDPECELDESFEDWISEWSKSIPADAAIVAIDAIHLGEGCDKYFFITSPMRASELRLLFGKYDASNRVHVWNHGLSF